MENILKTTLIGLFFGTFGTTLGGIIGVSVKNTSNRFLSTILSFASGLMISIVCFDLIPEALEISKISIVMMGIIFGIIVMILCDVIVQKKLNYRVKNKKNSNIKKEDLLRTGLIVSIGLALHNLPEGLAIGSGFEASSILGYSLAIAICLHDIPEGISMAVPMKNGGIKTLKVIYYIFLSGVTTGIGALLGAIVGEISEEIIAISLSFAAGAMLYIVSGELIPESNKLYNGKITAIGNIIGFLLGMIVLEI